MARINIKNSANENTQAYLKWQWNEFIVAFKFNVIQQHCKITGRNLLCYVLFLQRQKVSFTSTCIVVFQSSSGTVSGNGSHLCDSIRFDRGRHPPIYFVADSSSDAYHKQLYSKPTAYNCFSERTKDVLAYNLYKSTIKLRSDVNYTTRDNVGVRLDCAIQPMGLSTWNALSFELSKNQHTLSVYFWKTFQHFNFVLPTQRARSRFLTRDATYC